MSYRGPKPKRIAGQAIANPLLHAGQTATWRQYVSASAGNPMLGMGDSACYRESTITGVFGSPPALLRLSQAQTPGGAVIQADFLVSTRERLGRRDELVWNGEVYRVEGDPVPSVLNGQFVSPLKRGRV